MQLGCRPHAAWQPAHVEVSPYCWVSGRSAPVLLRHWHTLADPPVGGEGVIHHRRVWFYMMVIQYTDGQIHVRKPDVGGLVAAATCAMHRKWLRVQLCACCICVTGDSPEGAGTVGTGVGAECSTGTGGARGSGQSVGSCICNCTCMHSFQLQSVAPGVQ